MKKEQSLKKLLYGSSEIIGSISGALVGTAVAGPAGTIVGATLPTILSNVFKKISKDVLSRNISKREEQKIGTGYYFALKRMEKNISNGLSIREDGFIDEEDILSDSNIILEGVTVKLQKEWELKKLVYYGNFLGNISFRKDININYATVLLRLVESLSYRQLCIVFVIEKHGTPKIDLSYIDSSYKKASQNHEFNYSLYSDLVDLINLSVLRPAPPYVLGATLGNCVLSDIGQKLFELMNLSEIDNEDYMETKRDLENMLSKRF